MSRKTIFLNSLLVAFLSLGLARGQDVSPERIDAPPTPSYSNDIPVLPGQAFANGPPAKPSPSEIPPWGIAPTREVDGSVGPSAWILYPRSPGCTCPVGGCGPIGWELYLRSGISAPVGGDYFDRVLSVGWGIEGGGRSLFFNTAMDAAWVVELGVGNIHNEVSNGLLPRTLTNLPELSVPSIIIPAVQVTVKGLNRTYGSLDVGREWFLLSTGDETGPGSLVWRAGMDGGARYGTMKLELNEIRHLTDTYAGAFCAVHTELDVPYGPGYLVFGVRAEFAYTWDDVMQRQNNSDFMDINMLVNIGYRY